MREGRGSVRTAGGQRSPAMSPLVMRVYWGDVLGLRPEGGQPYQRKRYTLAATRYHWRCPPPGRQQGGAAGLSSTGRRSDVRTHEHHHCGECGQTGVCWRTNIQYLHVR
eukprot:scaffold10003_cov117-Isochrysis_galbana.AAC.2